MFSRRRSTISRHLDLMQESKKASVTDLDSPRFDEIEAAPIFSSKVRHVLKDLTVFSEPCLSQYGFLGVQDEIHNGVDGQRQSSEELQERDKLLYANTNTPWSAFICGSQGAGKSHTLACLLENYLLSHSPASVLPNPLAGMIFHYDTFTSHTSTQFCEAAYLCSSGIPVRVLVSPTNIWAMEKLYTNLPGLPKGAPKPRVLPLRFKEQQLNCSNLRTLMAVKEGGQTPLYLAVLSQLLNDIAIERAGAPGIDYRDFKRRLGEQGFTEAQNVPLNMRLQLLESFVDLAPTSRPKSSVPSSNIWNFERGSLTIVDLSCPFVNEDEACALFSICLGLFLEHRTEHGRVVGLDEAHKFLTKSGEAEIFTQQLLSIIRQQRHLGARVLIATQEPTLSPSLIDLCNVTIVHRFLSPAWFNVLKDHLAGAAQKSSNARDEIFRIIVELQPGQALLFSPTSVLDVATQPSLRGKTLNDSYIKLRVRNRITVDGGKSVLATDRTTIAMSSEEPSEESSEASEYDDTDSLAEAMHKVALQSSVNDSNNSAFSLNFGGPTAFVSGRSSGTKEDAVQHSLPEQAHTKPATHTARRAPPTAQPPSSTSSASPPIKKRVTDKAWKGALRTAVVKLYNEDSTSVDFGKARLAAAQALHLPRDFFNDYEWREKSKKVLKDEVEKQVARSGLPPPKNATWM